MNQYDAIVIGYVDIKNNLLPVSFSFGYKFIVN